MTTSLSDKNQTKIVGVITDPTSIHRLATDSTINFIDANNSTTATLGGTAVFTGVTTDITKYGTVFVNVHADEASATDGLKIQQSSDGTNWDHDDVYTVPAGGNKNYAINPYAKYLRVIYTNGGTAQASFRLQTLLKANSLASSHRIQDNIVDDDDARLVKSVLTAKANGGGFVNIQATASDNLRVTDAESGLAIAKGDVVNTTFISKFGQNEDIGTGAFEDIWDGGGTYTWPADDTAPITHLYSTDGGDTQDVEAQGLDINGDMVTQTITLTGTTVSILSTALWRVFRLKNVDSTDIAGVVHASDSGKAVSYAQIQNGNNQTLMALYTVPTGKTGYLVMGGASLVGLARNYSLDGHFHMRPFGGVFQLKHTFGVSSDGTSTFQHEYKIPLPIEEKTDIRVSAKSSADGGIMNSTFDIVLIDN